MSIMSSSTVPRDQLSAVEAGARDREAGAEAERRALQQELLQRTAEAMALDEENATLRRVAVSASTGSIKVRFMFTKEPLLVRARLPASVATIPATHPSARRPFPHPPHPPPPQLRNANFDVQGILQEISRTECIGEAVDIVREENVFLHNQLGEQSAIDAGMSMSELRADMVHGAATMRAAASSSSPAAFRDTSTRYNQAEGAASTARTPAARPSASELNM